MNVFRMPMVVLKARALRWVVRARAIVLEKARRKTRQP